MNPNHLMIGLGVAVLGAAALAVPAQATHDTGTAQFVHGVPDTPVDVCLDGNLQYDDLQPGTRTEAITLDAGDHDVTVLPSAAAGCEDAPLGTGTATINADADADVVVHLDTDGDVVSTTFDNDTSMTRNGQGRIVLRHAADVDAVDANVDEEPLADGLTNGEGATDRFLAGDRVLSILPDGVTDETLVSSETVPLEAGTVELRYLIGSSEEATTQVLAFTLMMGELDPIAGDRIAGADRESTAVEISQEAYPDGAPVVYISVRSRFPDALAAKSLQDGPVLFAATCGYPDGELIHQDTLDEIERLEPQRVVALGGVNAICDDVLDLAVDAAIAGANS